MAGDGNSTTTVVTFSVELLLYTTLLTASCWFVEHYLAIMRVPALAFVVLDPLAVMAPVSAAMLILFFSIGDRASSGGLADDSVAQATQGFTVVASIMWGLLVACMFIEVPYISSVPGHEPTASALIMAMIIGFAVLVPLLAMIVTYAAVPGGQRNSLVFNGPAVGSFSLLFLVILALGNGGVGKCSPYAGSGTSFIFSLLVIVYWVVLYAVEILVFSEWDPLVILWNKVTGHVKNSRHWYSAVLGHFSFNLWRVVGGVVNEIVLGTALSFTKSTVHALVVVVMLVVAALHVPMVLKIHAQTDVASKETAKTADMYEGGEASEFAEPGASAVRGTKFEGGLDFGPRPSPSAPPKQTYEQNQYPQMQVFQAGTTPMRYVDSQHNNQRLYNNNNNTNNNNTTNNNNNNNQRQNNSLNNSELPQARPFSSASFPFVDRQYNDDTLPLQRRGMGVV